MQFKSDIRLSSDDYLKTYFTFKVGDIAFEGHQSKEFRYGRFVENDIGDGVVSHIFTVFRPIQRFDLHFWKYAINSENLMQKILSRSTKASTMMHDLVPEDFLNETFLVPSIDEQKAVGKFLHQIDNLLTLHQRKYEKLLNIKKSMLEKMFPKEGEVVPEIRFKGFTGAWEQRKLSDIAERITRKNTHLESTLPLTISSSYGLIDQYAYFNNRVASRNTRNYYLIKNGEFAYNKSYSDGFPFGSVKRLDRYAMGVLSTLYIIFSIDYRKVNSDFLVSYYDTKNWHHQVALRAAEGARNHGLLNISADDFFETELKIPMNLDEQKKIGSFFDQLNSFITLHQRQQNGGYLWLENSAKQVCFAIITASGYRSTKKALSDQLR